MNCDGTNAEEIRDLMLAPVGARFYTTWSTSLEESKKRLQDIAKHVKEKWDGDTRTRTVAAVPVELSPTVVAAEIYPAEFTEEQKKRGKVSGLIGDEVHLAMEDILPLVKNKKPVVNKFKIKDRDFKTLTGTAEALIRWGDNHQKSINPTGKWEIVSEQLLASANKKMTGRTDLVFLFSDGTGVIFDYKTVHMKPNWETKGQITTDQFFGSFRDKYDFQIREYAQIYEKDYGIRILESMIVPFIVDIDYKNKTLKSVRSYQGDSRKDDAFLGFIPTVSSKVKPGALNNLIDSIQERIKVLEKQKLSKNKRKIESLKRQFESLVFKKDIELVAATLDSLKKEHIALTESPGFKEEENLLTNFDKLTQLQKDVGLYTNIQLIYEDLAVYSEDKEELKAQIRDLNMDAELLFEAIEKEKHQFITTNYFEERDIQADGSFTKQKKLNLLSRTFLAQNSIDNSFVRALMKVINNMYHMITFHVNKDKDFILATEKAAIKRLGSTQALYDMLINRKTGNIYSGLSQDFYKQKEKIEALDKKEDQGLAYQKLYELRDESGFKKELKERRTAYKLYLEKNLREKGIKKGAYYDSIYKKRLAYWEKSNDLLDSDAAWAENNNRVKYTTLKESVKEQYSSPEFKKIQSIPEVLAYYNMWTGQMEKIRIMLDLNYDQVGNNFIPWFRRTTLDRIMAGEIGSIPAETKRDLSGPDPGDMDMFNYLDKEGHNKSIPILGIHTLKNSKGAVDVTEKDYDLTKSLLTFTKLSYHAKFAREAEGHALAVKEMHADKAGDLYFSSGKEETNYRGKQVVDKLSAMYDINNILSKTVDRHIYSIYTEELIDPKNDKIFKKLINYNAGRLLGLAVMPAIAGGWAAYLQLLSVEKKELYWKQEHGKKANALLIASLQKRMSGDGHLDKAAMFNKFFDVFIESDIEKAINKANPTFTKKWLNERSLYMFFRTSDEAVDAKLSLSLAQNYGYDEEGNLKQLENLPEGTKSVWELFKFNEITGEKSFGTGLTEKQLASRLGSFSTLVGQIQYRIKGSMPKGESAAYQQNLILKAVMQFKNWMPGVALERLEGINYNSITDTVNMGRYVALWELRQVSKEDIKVLKNAAYWGQVGLNLMYKMINRKHLLAETEFGKAALTASFGRLEVEIQDYFIKKGGNTRAGGEQAYREYIEKQMAAMAAELKYILGSTLALMAMGMTGAGEDKDEEFKDLSYATRQFYRLLRKMKIEVAFAYDPMEILGIRGIAPMLSILTDFGKFTGNTVDEFRDWVFGEESSNDKAEILHYGTLLITGGRQFRQTADFIWPIDSTLPK